MKGAADAERYVRQLSEFVADRRITLEVCITSNMQTMPSLEKVENHPFGRMVRDRLSVTLCTDNRLVSQTTVTREIEQAVEAFQLDPRTLRNIVFHGFKRSFFPGTYREKRTYVRQIIDYFDRVAAEHGSAWRGSAMRRCARPSRERARAGELAPQYLRGLAHELDPLVLVGKGGLPPGWSTTSTRRSESHELVKVKFNDFKETKKELATRWPTSWAPARWAPSATW